jgi:hypothetical protein
MNRGMLVVFLMTVTGCEVALTEGAPYGSVRIEATSRANAPLPGIDILLYTGRRPMGYGTTDTNGLVVFRQVPPGGYAIRATLPERYADLAEFNLGPSALFSDGFSVEAGKTSTRALTFLLRGTGSLEARARDSSGVPIRGLTIDFYRSSGYIAKVLTDTAGLARMDSVPLGYYGAAFTAPDSLGVPNQPFTFRDMLFVDGESPARAEFTVATCFGNLAVDVRDQDGAPATGVTVVRYVSSGRTWTATTDANGGHDFGRVPCGDYGVFAQPSGAYEVTPERGLGFADGLRVTKGLALRATLRVTRP